MPALTKEQRERIYGKFTWTEGENGRIIPDPTWVKANIVTVKVPYQDDLEPPLKKIQCHRLIAESIENAFDELDRKALLHLVRSIDGCYVPRHVLWQKNKPLSEHAWAIALDVNARLYPYGSSKVQDPRLLKVFANHGFLFGHAGSGLWQPGTTPDPMHASYVYLR